MAYTELKNSIKQAIKQNGNQEITGDVMQTTLLNMIGPAGLESGYLLRALPVPTDSPKQNEDERHIYIPKSPGVYSNFNNTKVAVNSVSVFAKSGDAQWNNYAISTGAVKKAYGCNRLNAIIIDTEAMTITYDTQTDGSFILLSDGSMISISGNFDSPEKPDNTGFKSLMTSFQNNYDGKFIQVFYNKRLKKIFTVDKFGSDYKDKAVYDDVIELIAFHSTNKSSSNYDIDGMWTIDHSIFGRVVFNGKLFTNFTEVRSNAGLESGFTNMYLIGDSWTEGVGGGGTHYWDNIKADCGLSKLTVDGIGGTTWTTSETNNFISRLSAITAQDDLIVILGGTNDYGHNQPLGSFGDTDTTTFYGALNTGIQFILKHYPLSTLALITPGQRAKESANSQGHTLIEYVNAIKEVAAYYSVPVLDIYEGFITGRDNKIKEELMPDGLHPNSIGYKRLGRKIAKFINYKL